MSSGALWGMAIDDLICTYNLTTWAGNVCRQGTLPNQTGVLSRRKGGKRQASRLLLTKGGLKGTQKVHHK